jgi:hypothetical protein
LQGRRIWVAAGIGTAAVALLHLCLAAGFAEPAWEDPSESPAEPLTAVSGEKVVLFVVGDSVARSLARGLEVWGRAHGVRVVNGALVGCGVASPGVRLFPVEIGENIICQARLESWKATIEREHPDAVLVLPGVWDLVERRLADGEAFRGVGDPAFDAWLIREYVTATDILGGSGRHVFWLTFPCPEQKKWPGLLGESAALRTQTVVHLNQFVLPTLISRRSEATELLPFAEKVCPGGLFSHEVGRRENFRSDGLHFRAADALWVADWLGPEVLMRLGRRAN